MLNAGGLRIAAWAARRENAAGAGFCGRRWCTLKKIEESDIGLLCLFR
jgi:hypothetical protein